MEKQSLLKQQQLAMQSKLDNLVSNKDFQAEQIRKI